MKYDVVIIGAGIIGSLMSDKLARYNLNVCILEKNSDSSLEQSMSSSAIVHSGIDPTEGSLKAELNVIGNQMMEEICNELAVTYYKTGGYICAKDDEEYETIKKKYHQACKRNIEAKIISGDELREIEPNVAKDVIYALSMPTTAVIYPVELSIAALERSSLNGVKIYYDTCVESIKYDDDFEIVTNNGIYKATYVINVAGLGAGNIAKMLDDDFDIVVTPKRGEYFVTDNKIPVVNSVIYPTPNKNGKGVLAVPTTHKNVLLGPNGVYQDSFDDDATHKEDLNFVRENVGSILSHFPTDIIKTYAGLRSTGNNGDFYIEYSKNEKMINAVCIDSPGLASSPAIVEKIFSMLKLEKNLKLDYVKNREPYLVLKNLSLDEQNKLISENPLYGKIICRCEQISEGEIVDSIRKVNGAKDLTGIKFRVRPMLGMCQGGFCETEVVKILARELQVDPSMIKRRGSETFVIKRSMNEKV